jgi:hypothetical protein
MPKDLDARHSACARQREEGELRGNSRSQALTTVSDQRLSLFCGRDAIKEAASVMGHVPLDASDLDSSHGHRVASGCIAYIESDCLVVCECAFVHII